MRPIRRTNWGPCLFPILLLLFLSSQQTATAQSVGISSSSITPDASSILELRTTSKGLLIPRMTTAERDAIATPATGLMLYNTTTGKFNYYNGSTWVAFFAGTSAVSSITGTSNRITIGGTSDDPTVDIAANYAGQNTITTLGTIGTGTWNGTAIGIGYGGTGATTQQAAINALTGTQTNGYYLRSNGTNAVLGAIQAGDVPTLNQNTTGSAATLTTSRLIHGGSFDGSADVTNIIASTYGGTGNGFTKFSGATTSEKTYTLPDASTTILTTNYTGALATGILKNTTSTGALSIAVPADFPTLNQNTTGSAATLTTSRNIYGNAFNGSADLTGIIASTFGGTGNGFTKFTGPATAEKTFTLPNANATILTDNTAVTAAQGGTGQSTYTIGDMLYASSTTALSKLNAVAAGSFLRSAGTSTAPVWSTTTWPNAATTGDLVYASGTNTYANLTGVATGNALISGGVGTAPSWGKIGLTTHVSGTLPIANGGTNSTATPTDGGMVYGDGTSYQVTAAGTAGQVLQSNGAAAPAWVEGGTMMFSGSSNNAAVNNTTLYFQILGTGLAGAAADAAAGTRTLISRNGNLKNLYVKLSAAIGAGKTGTVTVFKNGVATALLVTLNTTGTAFTDLADVVSVAAGDEIGIRVTTTGNVKFSWACDFIY